MSFNVMTEQRVDKPDQDGQLRQDECQMTAASNDHLVSSTIHTTDGWLTFNVCSHAAICFKLAMWI
jgi:hypothetical protein